MWEDQFVEEVRRTRQAHATRFNHNLKAIYHDLKQQEKDSGRPFVSFPARREKPKGEVACHEAR